MGCCCKKKEENIPNIPKIEEPLNKESNLSQTLDVEKIEFIRTNQNFDLGKTDPKKYHKNLLPNIKINIRNNKYCDPNFQNISSSYGK